LLLVIFAVWYGIFGVKVRSGSIEEMLFMMLLCQNNDDRRWTKCIGRLLLDTIPYNRAAK
jgi:hypothetical protein